MLQVVVMIGLAVTLIGVFLIVCPSHIAAEKVPSSRQNKNRSKVFLLGDATMGRTAKALSHILDGCIPIDYGNRCDVHSNETLTNETAPNASAPSSFAPITQGKSRRGCEDCHDCQPMKWWCREFDIDFLDIEFAAHEEFSIPHRGVAHSNRVAGYLKKSARKGDFIASNIGFYDSFTTSNSSSIYMQELERFLNVLLEIYTRPYIRWITSPFPASGQQISGWSNTTPYFEVITHLNLASKALMNKHSIKVLDLAMISRLHHFQELRQDAIHIGDENQPWYRSVAFAIFVQFAGLLMSPTCEARDCGNNLPTPNIGITSGDIQGGNNTMNVSNFTSQDQLR